MVVDVAYISKECSDGLGNTPGSVTGILAVQGAKPARVVVPVILRKSIFQRGMSLYLSLAKL